MSALARCRPAAHEDPVTKAVLTACKALAQRIEYLQRQTDELTAEIDTVTTALNPALRAALRSGPRHRCSAAHHRGHQQRPAALKKRRSPCSPASPPSRRPRGKPPPPALPRRGPCGEQSRCTASPWFAGPTIRAPATTSPANRPRAAPRKTFCDCSNAPSPAKCSHCSPRLRHRRLQRPTPSPTSQNITITAAATTSTSAYQISRLNAANARHTRHPLPPMAQHPDHRRRLTPNRDRSINTVRGAAGHRFARHLELQAALVVFTLVVVVSPTVIATRRSSAVPVEPSRAR